ncbi:hypothetical protein GCM10007876_07610 [Litoribrevibacter albus]|uniref:Acyltransferase 3 domain-containing protein n=2 Tax=Litoribrevibacter albus TaxID=1473156 RepID=A0AA37W6J0_9GAMM|nr:hypothetical protein GCM10007876_07610 [Litoribrevibacter albus]
MFYQYVHNLRGLAILLVISAHVISVVPFDHSLVADMVRSVLKNCTVIFVLIGGWLFSYLASKYSYKSYLVSKLKKVVVPYVVISIPALTVYLLGLKDTHPWVDLATLKETYGYFGQVIFYLSTGAHLGPLWFMPMIFIFYLLFPVFKSLSQSRLLIYMLLFSLFPAVFLGRPDANDDTLQSFIYFLPVWLIGMFLFQHRDTYQWKGKCFFSLVTLFFLALLAIYSLFDWDSRVDLILKIVAGYLLFSGFSNFLNKPNRFLGVMADLSFYLFFIHGYFIAVFRGIFSRYDFLPQGVVAFIIVFFVVIFLSVLSFYFFRFILKEKTGPLLGAYR